jgi:hypothetical protein
MSEKTLHFRKARLISIGNDDFIFDNGTVVETLAAIDDAGVLHIRLYGSGALIDEYSASRPYFVKWEVE